MPVLFAANRSIIPISSCTEGIHRFVAKSAEKNKWRSMKQEKRTGNPVDLLENQKAKALLRTKLYGRARLPWPNHIVLFLLEIISILKHIRKKKKRETENRRKT